MSRYAEWAQREYGETKRIAVLPPAGPVFLGLLPFVVGVVGPRRPPIGRCERFPNPLVSLQALDPPRGARIRSSEVR